MKRAFLMAMILAFALPAFASDWAVRWDYANIRKEPSIKGMKIYQLEKTQYAGITYVAQKSGWIKVQFEADVTWKAFNYLRGKGAEIKRVGSEGTLVHVIISGWTKKDNLRKI